MILLSYGSFSSVYEGKDNTVYKILDIDSPKIELTLLSSLNHKNVIKALDVNVEERCIQMRKYPMTLSKFIKENDYTINDVKSISLQLQSALGYLQSKRVVHCDIKPSNIMIDPKTIEVVIIDFGLSFVWNGSPLKFKRQGNWSYMSPEVCCGITVNEDPFRIDRFSLSMVIYKLLTRKTLLKWKTYAFIDIYNRIEHDDKKVCRIGTPISKFQKNSLLPTDDDTIAYYHIQSICDNLDYPPYQWISKLQKDKVKALIRWRLSRTNDIKNKRFIDNLKQQSRFKYDDIEKQCFFKDILS